MSHLLLWIYVDCCVSELIVICKSMVGTACHERPFYIFLYYCCLTSVSSYNRGCWL